MGTLLLEVLTYMNICGGMVVTSSSFSLLMSQLEWWTSSSSQNVADFCQVVHHHWLPQITHHLLHLPLNCIVICVIIIIIYVNIIILHMSSSSLSFSPSSLSLALSQSKGFTKVVRSRGVVIISLWWHHHHQLEHGMIYNHCHSLQKLMMFRLWCCSEEQFLPRFIWTEPKF